MNTADVLLNAEEFCKSLAPHELGNQPFYLIDQSKAEAAGLPKLGTSCLGFTHPLAAATYRDVIGDRWEGPAPAAVLNVAELLPEDGWDYPLLAIALHETAHILNSTKGPKFYRRELPPDRLPEMRDWAARSVDDATKELGTLLDDLTDVRHDGRFIRVACHLAWRSQSTETPINPGAVCAGRDYERSHGTAYLSALGDEPRRMVSSPFAEILSVPVPRAFKRLCRKDTSRLLRIQRRLAKGGKCSTNSN